MESTEEIFLQNHPLTGESQNFVTLSIFLVVSLALLTYYLAILQQRSSRVKASNVSGKPFSWTLQRVKWTRIPLPLLDGFITLYRFRKDGPSMLEELVLKYGPTFRLPFGITELIAVSDPNIIQRVLNSTNVGHLNKPRQIYDMMSLDNLKYGLIFADADIWSPHRKAVSKAFTYSAFQTYLKYIHDEAKEIAKNALSDAANDCEKTIANLQMKKLLNQHLFKITMHIVMGSENSVGTDDELAEFQEDFHRNKELAMDRFIHPYLLIKPIWLLHPKKREFDQVVRKYTEGSLKIVNDIRGKHKRTYSNTANGSSIVEDEADNHEGHEKPYECLVEKMIKAGLTNKEISDEIGTFLIAGYETVVTAIELLMFHLASNTEHQEKFRLEVDDLFNLKINCIDDCPNMEDLSTLKYLERCILESLRLTPTVPFFVRQLDTPLEIDNEFTMETGKIIGIMSWAVHRNPEAHPNTKVFDPDRFLPENVRKRHSHSFIPFSMGIRNCVGWKIALLQMKLIMASILRNFRMSTTAKLDDIKFLCDVTLKTEKQLNIMFKPRILK